MKLQLLIVFSFSLFCLLVAPCSGVGTKAGIEIISEVLVYTHGVSIEVPPILNIVDQVYGLELDVPVDSASLIAGKPYSFFHGLINKGNGPDNVGFSLSDTTDKFSSTLIRDDNGNGQREENENTPVPTNILLAEDASLRFFVVLESPADGSKGQKGSTNFEAVGSVNDGGPYTGATGIIYGGYDSVDSRVELTISEPLDITSPTISDILINKKRRFPHDIISPMLEFEATVWDDVTDNIGWIILWIYSYETGEVVRQIKWQDGFPESEGVHFEKATGKFTYFAPTPLSADTYTIKIEAEDKAGNGAMESISPLIINPTDDVYIVGKLLNFPNPFSPLIKGENTKIAYTLSTDATVTIYLYNIKGSVIKKWICIEKSEGGSAGYNEYPFDGRDSYGKFLGNGIYLCQIVHKGKIIGTLKLTVFDAR